MTNSDASEDRRVNRTRRAIFDAFRDQVLTRRYSEIRIGDIIDAADVGRSTFYDHFKSKDDVLLTSIEPLFAVLADAAAGKADIKAVEFVLAHFWEQRALARVIFSADLFFKLARKLAAMTEARLGGSDQDKLAASERAYATLGAIKAWLAGEFSISVDAFAEYLATQ